METLRERSIEVILKMKLWTGRSGRRSYSSVHEPKGAAGRKALHFQFRGVSSGPYFLFNLLFAILALPRCVDFVD